MTEKSLFWADQLADKIINRKTFHFSNTKIPKIRKWAIKSSSSLSGVLHIGRLSDIIRGEAVYRALKKQGFPADFIYVTEDMDPLRKVPEGVPKNFEQYIGHSVSDVPDPDKCHKSYADHFTDIFLKTFKGFLYTEPKVLSMRREYKKGSFTKYIIDLVQHTKQLKEILNKFREKPLDQEWTPWKPICDKCGNLQTTVVTNVDGTKIDYVCKDYQFETYTAKGCGYEGTSNLKKANGKLAWKGEWASQWKRWNVCCEGAGKEYNAPNSAWFVNAEICEKILDFPMPEPLFYEHLMIDDQKMSASLGNVVYPHQWLEVSRPEVLKMLYMKKLEKTRSFSWRDVPNLELEFDRLCTVKFNKSKSVDEKEAANMRAIYEYSSIKNSKQVPMQIDYANISSLVQIFPDEKTLLSKLKDLGIIKSSLPKQELSQLKERIKQAKIWVEKYAPPEAKVSFAESPSAELSTSLNDQMRSAVNVLLTKIKAAKSAEQLQQEIYETAKANGLQPAELFKTLYLAILAKSFGPRLGVLIFALGKERVIQRLKDITSTTS